MAGTPDKVLSRDFEIKVNTGTVEVPIWTKINGLDEDGITIKPTSRETDFADANDEGFAKPVIIGRGYSVSLKGARLEASDDGTRDPGQAAVEAVADATGYAARLQFKITSPAAATPEELTFLASVAEVGTIGGGEKSAWTAELKGYGQIART